MSTTIYRREVKTGRASGNVITQTKQAPAYAASIAITPDAEDCLVKVGALTGALMLTAVLTNSLIGDKLTFLFSASAADRTVTFGTGFASGTLVVLSGGVAISNWMYNGTSWIAQSSSVYVPADAQSPAYGASIAVTTTTRDTRVVVAQLTGALTLTAVTTNAVAGDMMAFDFNADSTARVVTFSTNFTAAGTLTVPASGSATAQFIFDGTSWDEVCRNDMRSSVDIQTPAYGATISLTTTKQTTRFLPAQLTGALTINAVVTGALAGDKIEGGFSADGTNRVVTFGTNFKSSGTLTVTASKFAGFSAIYDGTEWILMGREITA